MASFRQVTASMSLSIFSFYGDVHAGRKKWLSLSETKMKLQGRSNISKLCKQCLVRSRNDVFLLAKYLFWSLVSRNGGLVEDAYSKHMQIHLFFFFKAMKSIA